MKSLTEKEFMKALTTGTLLEKLKEGPFENVSMRTMTIPNSYKEFEEAITEFIEENLSNNVPKPKSSLLPDELEKACEISDDVTEDIKAPTDEELYQRILQLGRERANLIRQLKNQQIKRNVAKAEAARELFHKSINFRNLFGKTIAKQIEIHANLKYGDAQPAHFSTAIKLNGENSEELVTPVEFDDEESRNDEAITPQKEYSFIYEWSRKFNSEFDGAWGQRNLDKVCVHVNVDEKMAVAYDKQKLYDFIMENKLWEQAFFGKTYYERVSTSEPKVSLIRIVPANFPEIFQFIELK